MTNVQRIKSAKDITYLQLQEEQLLEASWQFLKKNKIKIVTIK